MRKERKEGRERMKKKSSLAAVNGYGKGREGGMVENHWGMVLGRREGRDGGKGR